MGRPWPVAAMVGRRAAKVRTDSRAAPTTDCRAAAMPSR